ncbi:MAG: T9SS type A sorting domain-containing protein [Flavobacteriales bacterium]
MRRPFLVLFSMFTILTAAFSQVADMGSPRSFLSAGKVSDLKDVPVYVMPEFDLDAQIQANIINDTQKLGPWMFGYEHITQLGFEDGIWETFPSGDRIWRIKLKTPGSVSINVVFNDFYLPVGSFLHVYSPDKSYVEGAYTAANNNLNNMLGTDIMLGEEMIVEYYEPSSVKNQGRLLVGMVVHGYRDISEYPLFKVNESGACNMDVICPDGAQWSSQKRSVARISMGGGLCTGALVNNTANDGTPYFLTANHCGPQNMGGAVFRFNYDSPICGSQAVANSQSGPTNQNVNGSVLRARRANSDFGLIQLNSVPPTNYNVYYAGWDNTGNVPNTTVGIHHPSGDVKKISFDDHAATIAAYGGNPGSGTTHWRVIWDRNTTTEGGSSGSPLFDHNQRIIGQLHGGGASCTNLTAPDWYGRFSVSWNGNSASDRLRDWLDPSNNTPTLDGYDPNAATIQNDAGIQSITTPSGTICDSSITPIVVLRNYGSNAITSVAIQYNVNGTNPQTFNWTGNLAPGSSANVTLNSITLVSGSYTFNATTNNPNGQTDGNIANNSASQVFNMFADGRQVDINITPDCWGSEITWQITNASNEILYSGGPYTDVSPSGPGTITTTVCLDPGCYDFRIADSYGDGMNGSQYQSCNVDGNYTISISGVVVDQMIAPNAAYGSLEVNNFCVPSSPPVGVYKNLLNTLRIFPNPSNEVLNIDLGSAIEENVQFYIIDISGKIVYENIIYAGYPISILDVSRLSEGAYYINFRIGEMSTTKPFIKY